MEEFFNKHIIKFTLIVTAPLWIAYAMASDIEEVIVVGQQEKIVETNPATDTNILNAIISYPIIYKTKFFFFNYFKLKNIFHLE